MGVRPLTHDARATSLSEVFMFNIKSSLWLVSAALLLILTAPVAKAAGMAPAGNFVSVRINGSHAAYGAILSPTKILVPAHVVDGKSPVIISVLAGSPDRTVTSCGTCQLRTISSYVMHPNYNNGGTPFSNDVAIIRVPALTYNANVFASTIAAPFSNAVGTQFTQIGYEAGGANHNRLQTTATTPWTLATMPGYVHTPGAFVTATVDTTLNGMISFSQSVTQFYTKLSDNDAWINAN
jgi:hypothetical protein